MAQIHVEIIAALDENPEKSNRELAEENGIEEWDFSRWSKRDKKVYYLRRKYDD